MDLSKSVVLLGVCGINGNPLGPPEELPDELPDDPPEVLLDELELAPVLEELLLELPVELERGSMANAGNLDKSSFVAAGKPKMAPIHNPRLTTAPTTTMVTPAPEIPLSLRFTFSPPNRYHDFLIIMVARAFLQFQYWPTNDNYLTYFEQHRKGALYVRTRITTTFK